jgi:hypothetical protein
MDDNPYESTLADAWTDSPEPSVLTPEQVSRLEWEIKKQANNALVSGVLGILFVFFVPMSFICGRRAIDLIEQHHVGYQYLRRAKRGI